MVSPGARTPAHELCRNVGFQKVPSLPPLVVLTDGTSTGGRPLTKVTAAAIDGGARAVLLREKQLPRAERLALAAELTALLSPVGGVLLVASDGSIAADGLHLAAADPFPDPHPNRIGRSCHSAAEVAAAAAEGCQYATLSPIFPTPSKPGYGPALGLRALAGHAIAVWALGGITAENAAACTNAGAAGIAVMGAVMRAADPAAAAAALLSELARAAR